MVQRRARFTRTGKLLLGMSVLNIAFAILRALVWFTHGRIADLGMALFSAAVGLFSLWVATGYIQRGEG